MQKTASALAYYRTWRHPGLARFRRLCAMHHVTMHPAQARHREQELQYHVTAIRNIDHIMA